MVKYIKCPRCDLNYIDPEKQQYCDVCIAEMKGNKLRFADLDEEDYDELELEEEQTEICPVCGVNTMRYGEKMCEACKQENEYDQEEEEVDIDKDEEWKNYLDEDTEGDLTIDDETLQEELDAEMAEEEDEEYDGDSDDDFFDEEKELSKLSDDDFDDDFDDDDEDDDDEDDDDF